jgi:hypothetical protein
MFPDLFDGEGLEAEHLLQLQQLREQSDLNAHLSSINSTLGDLAQESARVQTLPQCPWCGGRLDGRFEVCRHCSREIRWVEWFPCKPGEETDLRRKVDERSRAIEDSYRTKAANAAYQRQIDFERLRNARARNTYLMSVIVGLSGLLTVFFAAPSIVSWIAIFLSALWFAIHLVIFHFPPPPKSGSA